jgi:hypothetical protein
LKEEASVDSDSDEKKANRRNQYLLNIDRKKYRLKNSKKTFPVEKCLRTFVRKA